MKNISEAESLNMAISMLKAKQALELHLLRGQFHEIYENLKPINLLKNTLIEVTNSPEVKSNIVNSIIGLTTGYLSKKLLFGGSNNPVKKILGALLQFGIANIVSKHSETIKSSGEGILHKILHHQNGNV